MDLIFTKYMKALVSYEGINRQERFFFPPDAFRQLLLNAVVHKDYTETTPIQIKIYSDHIWMWNPGNMPEEVKVKDLFKKHVSKPRNPNIANVFFKSGYVESWGRGYYNIELACEETYSKLPKPKAEFGEYSGQKKPLVRNGGNCNTDFKETILIVLILCSIQNVGNARDS